VAINNSKDLSDLPATHVSMDPVLSSLDCMIFDREAVYASSEFTTGKRFYELCRDSKVLTAEGLKKALGTRYNTQLLLPNIDKGVTFARKLRGLGFPLVISPNPLFVKGWGQDEYLQLWVKVITDKCNASYFNDGWQFSNGCTLEYLRSVQHGIPVFDSDGRRLPVKQARHDIAMAITELEAEGFSVPKLNEVLCQLE